MIRWLTYALWVVVLIVLLSVSGGAQPTVFTAIGELMWASKRDKDNIDDGCPLAYDFQSHRFECFRDLISVSRDADALHNSVPNPAVLTAGEPKYWAFNDSATSCVGTTFMVPSMPIAAQTATIAWASQTGAAGDVVWTLDWCPILPGGPPCTPDGTADATITQSPSSTNRNDAVFSLATDWGVDYIVVMRICRRGGSAGDTHSGEARAYIYRMEFEVVS